MDDLISRQEAIEKINERARETFTIASGYEYYLGALHDVAYDLRQMPTIDAVPVKHGEWIRKSPTAWMWTCSCCKKDDAYAYSAGESFEPDVLQDLFCPNCGASMDGERKEE